MYLYAIISQSEKETGENPVRARRREVFFLLIFSVFLPQKTDKPLEFFLRRRKDNAPSRNIFQAKNPHSNTASAGKKR